MKKEIYLSIMGLAGLAAVMYICYRETEPKKTIYPDNANAMVIVPMNEDNEGRPLYTVTYQDSTVDYMYAEEIAASLLRDSLVHDEMIELCNENQ